MKFANKLFLSMMMILTVIFTIFGVWMLSSYFYKALEREREQAQTESQTYQYLFEMMYQSMEEYGETYAIRKAADRVAASVEKNGSQCFAWSGEDFFYGNAASAGLQTETLPQLTEYLTGETTYAYGIRRLEDRYVMVTVCLTHTREQNVYLGISRDITTVFEDRQTLLNQYCLALICLLFFGGLCIYALSRYITRPIRTLDQVAGQIAQGDYEKRSQYESDDEIGALSDHFNEMADCLMNQMYEKEQEARRKEKEAREKEHFTMAFAHELKTPLTSIIGYAELLNSVSLSEEERSQAYYFIYRQGKRLENLSRKLLELVTVEALDIAWNPVEIRDLEDTIQKTMLPAFEKKQIRSSFEMEEGTLYGDKDLLLSVFYNLLDNAVKAVEMNGRIQVTGFCTGQGYRVEVTDNGRGIPEQEIERITEAFYMVDKSRSRKEGGAGIGMALCQKIVSLHRGQMEIRSREGEGTTVSVIFPEKEARI